MMAHQHNRFTNLVHYICSRTSDPTKLGATKLNKVLWYADTLAYRITGKTISGEETYIKRQFGPVPRNILSALQELKRDGAINVRETEYFGKTKREYVALRKLDDAMFTEGERRIIDEVVDMVCDNHTAASISEMSHDLIWKAANIGENIPVFAVLAARTLTPSPDDRQWATAILDNLIPEGSIAA